MVRVKVTEGGTNRVPQEQNRVPEEVSFPFQEGGVTAGSMQHGREFEKSFPWILSQGWGRETEPFPQIQDVGSDSPSEKN